MDTALAISRADCDTCLRVSWIPTVGKRDGVLLAARGQRGSGGGCSACLAVRAGRVTIKSWQGLPSKALPS